MAEVLFRLLRSFRTRSPYRTLRSMWTRGFEPKPPMFGLVGALQNVAVISCWQTMPVSGSGELFV